MLQRELQQVKAENQQIKEENQQVIVENQQVKAENQQVKAENQQVKEENQQVIVENQQVKVENQQVKAENQQVNREKEQLLHEKDQTNRYLQLNNNHLTTQNQQLQQNNNQLATQTQELRQQNEHYKSETQSLQQQVEHQTRQLQELTVDKQQYQQQIRELRQQNNTQTWVVYRREINLSDKELGRGAYGWVKEGTFRGCKVAVKCLHDQLISDYNLHVFDREMTMAARCRHPNLLQFIGATNEGVPLIVTEIMHTSLRKKLERGEVSGEHIINISIGVACGLNYLHKTTPSPILHRDVSSANVLLNPLPSNQWLAKLSDFGSFNFMQASQTVNAGNPVYAAPEGLDPSKGAHSPAMDVYSFGVLLHEMCSRRLPTGGLTPAIVRLVNWKMPESSLVPLISSCVEESIQKRPRMDYLISELNRLQ